MKALEATRTHQKPRGAPGFPSAPPFGSSSTSENFCRSALCYQGIGGGFVRPAAVQPLMSLPQTLVFLSSQNAAPPAGMSTKPWPVIVAGARVDMHLASSSCCVPPAASAATLSKPMTLLKYSLREKLYVSEAGVPAGPT